MVNDVGTGNTIDMVNSGNKVISKGKIVGSNEVQVSYCMTGDELQSSVPNRPGRVVDLRGIVLQSDKTSALGAWLIRPVEMLDLHLAGLGRPMDAPALAIHAGLHVVLEDGREFVVEQLFGTPREDFVDGLNWTPLKTFRERDHAGWDVTVPATAFRGVDENVVHEVVEFLNRIEGRPFFGEDCTTLIERAFGKRRLFADSPTAQALGFGIRVGDPALTLLKPGVWLDPDAERLLRANILRALPDPTTPSDAPNGRLWIRRILGLLLLIAAVGGLSFYTMRRRKHRRYPIRRLLRVVIPKPPRAEAKIVANQSCRNHRFTASGSKSFPSASLMARSRRRFWTVSSG
jgi:hypothetical protein